MECLGDDLGGMDHLMERWAPVEEKKATDVLQNAPRPRSIVAVSFIVKPSPPTTSSPLTFKHPNPRPLTSPRPALGVSGLGRHHQRGLHPWAVPMCELLAWRTPCSSLDKRWRSAVLADVRRVRNTRSPDRSAPGLASILFICGQPESPPLRF